jgi:hypothetical protein
MRALSFAPAIFSIAFCLAYVPVFSFDWPLFLYYPLHGDFSRTALPEEMGPAMHWYGLVATTAMIALIAAFVCRDRWLPSGLHRWLWLVPVLSMAEVSWTLRGYFQ